MKTTILRIAIRLSSALLLAGICNSALAQGTVAFLNNSYSLVTWYGMPLHQGFVELLWAPAGTASTPWQWNTLSQWLAANPGWQAIDSSITAIGPFPGRFNGGAVTVPTATPGAPIQARVAAWEGNYAAFDWAFMAGANVAMSETFFVDTGNPTTTPPGVPASIVGRPDGFRGIPVPEPQAVYLLLLALGLKVRGKLLRLLS